MNATASEPHPIVAELNRRSVARLWREGKDTLDIAQALSLTEPEVCRILARIQDERHTLRQGGAA